MGKTSARSLIFHRESVPGDNTCLFWSFLFGIKPVLKEILGDVTFDNSLNQALNDGLRMLVTGRIRRDRHLRDMALSSGTKHKTVEAYCLAIEQGELWGGEPELNVLSDLFNIIVCVIDPRVFGTNGCLLPFYYGRNNPLATRCLYILHNGTNHYDPLYLGNIENSDQTETLFDPNDQMVNDLLKRFIRKLHHNVDVELGLNIVDHENELPGHTKTQFSFSSSNETKIIKSYTTISDKPIKRKESEIDDIVMSLNNDKSLLIPISSKYYVKNKRIKKTYYTPDQMSPFYENASKTINIGDLIQSGDILDQSNKDNNQIADLPMILNDEYQEEEEANNNSDSE